MTAFGGSVSADRLESMLIDQCSEMPKTTPVYIAADALYEKLKQKACERCGESVDQRKALGSLVLRVSP
jgi:hypothetical protein